MFGIKIKSKEITVDAFTYSSIVYDLFQPQRGVKAYPSWLKNMSMYSDNIYTTQNVVDSTFDIKKKEGLKESCPHLHKASSMKTCPGILDAISKGFVLFSEMEAAIASFQEGVVISRPPNVDYSLYDFIRSNKLVTQGKLPEGFTGLNHIKYSFNWLFQEKSGVEFLAQDPFWFDPSPTRPSVFPGVLNLKYVHQMHAQLLLRQPEDSKGVVNYSLRPGTPLLHILPLSEKRINIKTHLVSEEEYVKKSSFTRLGLSSSYRLYKRKLEQRGK